MEFRNDHLSARLHIPLGDFSFQRDFQGIFQSRSDNILLVKASWWLPK